MGLLNEGMAEYIKRKAERDDREERHQRELEVLRRLRDLEQRVSKLEEA